MLLVSLAAPYILEIGKTIHFARIIKVLFKSPNGFASMLIVRCLHANYNFLNRMKPAAIHQQMAVSQQEQSFSDTTQLKIYPYDALLPCSLSMTRLITENEETFQHPSPKAKPYPPTLPYYQMHDTR